MKKIYICHEFGGVYDNAKLIVDHIHKLVSFNKRAVYISPVLMFGHLNEQIPYELSMEYCKEILKGCDLMLTFGDASNSRGCMIEKDFCKRRNIKVMDYIDYLKQYTNKD